MTKYKIYVLFFFIISLYTFSMIKANENNQPLLGKIIYVDPGHGGVDPGAIYKEIEEATLNLQISEKLKIELEKKGATVYLTRYGDYDLAVPNAINRKRSDLSRRGNLINKSLCDLYISIHLNADPSTSWYGAQVFYDDINIENKKIADIMQKQLSKNLRTSRKYTKTDEMYLHKRINQPGVLIEVGFLTNSNERYLLKKNDYQIKVSSSIVSGIINYFK